MSSYDNTSYFNAKPNQIENPADSQPPPYFKPDDIPPGYADSQAHTTAEQRFVGKRVWNDIWAIVAFSINFLIFAFLCALGINTLIVENKTDLLLPFNGKRIQIDNSTNSTVLNVLNIQMISIALPVSIGVSLILTILYALLVYFFTKAMLIVSYFFSAAIMIATGVYLIYVRVYILGGILCGLGVLIAMLFCCVYGRLDFTAQLVKCVMFVIGKYPSIALLSLISLLFQVILAVLWGFGIAGCTIRFADSQGATIALSIYLVFSFYWNAQMISNSNHTACSGVFSAYYFLGETVQMPKRPVLTAVKNAFGPASGSVAFGSLLIAIIQTLRTVLRQLTKGSNSGWAQLIGCCLDCILASIEGTARYFNRYAFVQVAIYGKSFYQSAKACVTLFGQKGFDAVINDNFVENLFLLGGVAIGVLSGVGGWLAATQANTVAIGGNFGFILGLIGGAVGMFIFSVLSGVISSGIASIFVCLAEDPQALQRTKPELYEKFREVYPEIIYPVAGGGRYEPTPTAANMSNM